MDGPTLSIFRLRRLTGVLAICAVAFSPGPQAETLPPKGSVDSRVRTVPYNEEEVYLLPAYVGYQVDLQFEPGESFVGIGAGDIQGLSFVAADNHLFLKPTAARVGTNLTVLTTRRHYQFDYTASSRRPDPVAGEVIYSLRFTYSPALSTLAEPGDPAEAQSNSAAALDKALAGSAAGRLRNIDYWYCGYPSLKPVAASDDGVHTRIRFGARAELPAVFVRNDDGTESLLNFSMDAGDVILHRVVRRLVLRRGKLTGCIVNRGYAGSGERLDSGTITPSVERVMKGVRP